MFSFTDFQGCSTATVVLLLESMQRGIETNSAFIDTGFSCLRYMATENQRAKTGIRYVEELRTAADEVIEKSAQLPIGNRNKSIGDYGMTAYQEWIQAVVDGHSAQTTDYESATMVESSTIAEPTQNRALRSPSPESDFSTKGLQEPSKTVDESGQLTLQSASEFAVQRWHYSRIQATHFCSVSLASTLWTSSSRTISNSSLDSQDSITTHTTTLKAVIYWCRNMVHVPRGWERRYCNDNAY